jgi:hypothetical protein
MAQPPQKNTSHPAPHAPLRDPAEGKPPAVVEAKKQGKTFGPDEYPPTIGVKGEPIEDGERDPDTVAEEQRKRSDEIQAMGSEAWKAAHDERAAGDKPEYRPAVAAPAKKLEAGHRP